MSEKTVRKNIYFPTGLLSEVDSLAKAIAAMADVIKSD